MSRASAAKFTNILRFARKGGIAILEEGVFAASNFLVAILLGRWMAQVDYGVFTSAYSIFLLIATTFYSAIALQPMLLFGSRDHSGHFANYFGSLLWIHVWLSGTMCLGVAALATLWWWAGSAEMGKTLLALAGVAPFVTLLWLGRRAHYARLNPEWPLLCGVLYLICVILGCYLLQRAEALNSITALVVMGVASLVASIPMIAIIRPQRWGADPTLSPRTILAKHWHFGKWSALTSGIRWSNNYAYYLLLPLHIGMAASAVLRAHMNLILPVLHINAALFGILIPQFASILAKNSKTEFWRLLFAVLLLYTVGALVFWVLLYVFANEIMNLLYGAQYKPDKQLFVYLGLVPLFSGIAGVLESALSAAGEPKAATLGYVASMVITFTIGWGLLVLNGVSGAAMGLLIASIASACILGWQLARVMREAGLRRRPQIHKQ
jgi:O-antigen/teichoic acid export membrane protein